MNFPHFTSQQIFPFFLSAVLLIAAVLFFHAGKRRISIILLFLGSLGLGFFMAGLDPFLTLWDEQYHALVAKNMMAHPFKPMLFASPLYEYSYQYWTGNHIWLHKQPLFLWQMALSLKIFGVNELGVRAPDIFMHALAVMMIYRIGKIAYNTNVGFYGALFFAVAYFPLELIAGHFETDHNDMAFLFYVTASIWAWFEYQHTHRWGWLIVIGIFAGGAVLVKWLVGLLVFAVWMMSAIVSEPRAAFSIKTYMPALISLAVAALVFLPWQIYILYRFPLEAHYEFQLNTRHFFQTVENHGGDVWFHIKALKTIYGAGDLVPWLILSGLFFLIKNATNKIYGWVVVFAIVIVYSFFTISATKMTSFCIIVSPFVFLGLAALAETVAAFLMIKVRSGIFDLIFRSFCVIAIAFFLINLSKIQNNHTLWKPHDNFNRPAELAEKAAIEKTATLLQDEKYVVFNVNTTINGHIAMMFYTDYLAYDFVPSEKQLEIARSKAYKIAIFNSEILPDYIRNDEQIIKIRF